LGSRLVRSPLDPAPLVASVAAPSRGAIVTFLGTVRDSHDGRQVKAIDYTAYEDLAERTLERIVGELGQSGPDLALAIQHRLGTVSAGEASVVIVTAAPHRDAAYAANRTALERLKREVPIWKCELYADGSRAWREVESLRRPQAPPQSDNRP
jgi:molybdopterin synthase catalytic subunit